MQVRIVRPRTWPGPKARAHGPVLCCALFSSSGRVSMVSFSLARRLRPALASAFIVAGLTQLTGAVSPAQAQGFLSQLFGFAAPASPAPQRATPAKPRSATHPASQPSTRWIAVDDNDRPRGGGRTTAPEGSGGFTTMCVRMCDGFYFPISHRVPRSRFHTDAEACRSRCGESEARLFYFSSAGGDMGSAVDLTGRSYARLPIAFAHRKRLVAGCTCRPEPWSQASAIRHEGYAIAEGRSLSGGPGRLAGLTVVAGNYDAPAQPAPTSDSAAETELGEEAAPGGTRSDLIPAPAPAETADASTQPPGEPSAAAPRLSGAGTLQPARTRPATGSPAAGGARRSPQAGSRTARAAAPRPVQQAQTRKPTRVASAGPAAGSRLVWPGDAPARVR
jgi:hypothetical protein